MTINNHVLYSRRSRFMHHVWRGALTGFVLVVLWMASGCGGYHNTMTSAPSNSPMPTPGNPQAPMHGPAAKKK
jgi:hypothetical protein